MKDKALFRKERRALLLGQGPASVHPNPTLLSFIHQYRTIFAYQALGYELSPALLLEEAHTKGILIGLPRIENRSLIFRKVENLCHSCETGSFSIREPKLSCAEVYPDGDFPLPLLIMIPGLAFTRQGGRLGRGGGYYDRFLCDLRKRESLSGRVTLAGICLSSQIVDALPEEAHDERVDCLIDENGSIFYVDSQKGVTDGRDQIGN
ncbi:MAG: 5-formyltetrahydrofolate cyclo-ligase [Spirochaetales bacterium]|nr:5-formyltetrahydrofolate cyclo-ligase [Spirochaetales bacterium]